ncbi:MAG TPA: histidine phosphatase family protein [Usitatibacter sp.]
MKIRFLALSLAAVLALFVPRGMAAGADEERIWSLLRSGGQVVLMRHTVTPPGVGDPPGMRVDDCSTQRNLTEEGRGHATAIGEVVRLHGVEFDRVLSSPMCRCLETARLAFGRAEIQNSTVNPRGGIEDKPREVREMRALATEKRRGGNVILVSHGTTITGVTGLNVEPGEMVVVMPQGDGHFELRGRLRPAVPAP